MHQLSWTVIKRELLKKMNIWKSCSLDYVIWRVLGELTNEHTVPSTVYIWKVTENEAGIRNIRHINVILVCICTVRIPILSSAQAGRKCCWLHQCHNLSLVKHHSRCADYQNLRVLRLKHSSNDLRFGIVLKCEIN